MKHRFLVFIAVLGIPAIAITQTTRTPAAALPTPSPTVDLKKAPSIIFDNPNFDFGEVEEGPDITHDFLFYNRGKSTLHIEKVTTSCGCTAAVIGGSNDIPPGGKNVVKATYHTRGRPGHATKVITVSSNDPANPAFQLKLEMTVAREVEAQPDRLFFYAAKYRAKKTSTFKVLGKPTTSLKVLSAESENKVVNVTSVKPYIDELQKRNGAEIEVTLPETAAIGPFQDKILIKTDNTKKPEIRVPVIGEVLGRVQYYPKSLAFNPSQNNPATVLFNADENPGDFAIDKAESAEGLVNVQITRPSGGGAEQYQLIVSPNEEIPKESDGQDQIIVHTNDRNQPEIIIEVKINR